MGTFARLVLFGCASAVAIGAEEQRRQSSLDAELSATRSLTCPRRSVRGKWTRELSGR